MRLRPRLPLAAPSSRPTQDRPFFLVFFITSPRTKLVKQSSLSKRSKSEAVKIDASDALHKTELLYRNLAKSRKLETP